MPQTSVRPLAEPAPEQPAFSDEALLLTDAPVPGARDRGRAAGTFASRTISDWAELEALQDAWEELASASVEPNPFYEPWVLLPALRSFARRERVEVVLVFRGELLCGLFPIVHRRGRAGLWRHPYCYLTAPLLRRGCERAAIHSWLDRLAARAAVVRLEDVPGDGCVRLHLVDELNERKWPVLLKRVEQDPDYAAILDRCLDEVGAQAGGKVPRMLRREGFIFLSSPCAVTPFHLDPEHNFLLQIRGSKTVSMWDREDRFVLPEAELERFYAAFVHRNLPWREVFQTTAWVVPLKPGQGLHFPVAVPHWVQNGPEVSISFSITFRSDSSKERELIYRANAKLRTLGLSPRPPGRSVLLDSTKRAAFSALSELKRVLARRAGEPRP